MSDDASGAAHLKPLLARRLRAIGLDVSYVRARGDHLIHLDEGGREVAVLDLVGGFGAGLFGHNHPGLVARASELLAADRPFLAQASARGPSERLAARLCARAEQAAGRPFVAHLASTGAEAVEAAIKHAEMERRDRVDRLLRGVEREQHQLRRRLRDGSARAPAPLFERAARRFGLSRLSGLDELFLRLYHGAREALDRPPTLLAVEGAFHGKTSGSLRLTHRAEYQAPWRGLGPVAAFLPDRDPAALAAALDAATVRYDDLQIGPDGDIELVARELVNVAACFVEPIQGEGGVHELSREMLRALREAADRHGFPLVMDEIQSGMGRTGRFFASEHAGVAGDYYLLSKALGGGLAKISALLVAGDRYQEEFGVLHTSTFADDDFSSEVALAALDLLDEDGGGLARRCAAAGAHLLGRLRDLMARYPDQIRGVRGRGLLVGVELSDQRDSPSALVRMLGAQELIGFLVSGWFLREERIRVAPTLSARATIRVEPSAYVEHAELDRFCAALERLACILRAGDAYQLVRFSVGRAGEPVPPQGFRSIRFAHLPSDTPRAPAPRPDAPEPPERLEQAGGRGAARVGFLTHFLAPGDLLSWDPRLAPLDDRDCHTFLARTRGLVEPFVAAHTRLRSPLGSSVTATIIGLPFTPDQVVEAMRAGGGAWARELIDQGIELARRLGCAVIGFGGFTSILTQNCRTVVASDIALTTGNSLTAAAALEATQAAARRIGLSRRVLGVVGAIGNIGRVLAEVAADWVDEIVLVGRPGAERRLAAAAAAIAASRTTPGHPPIRTTTDLFDLRGCDIVVTASNAARPVVLPEHVADDRPVVVCDVAVPSDVHERVARERPRATVLRGGVVRAPLGQPLAIRGMNLPPGEVYGCLAETLLMGLAGIGEDFSYGALDPLRVRRIRDLALLNGFALEENPVSPATE